LWLAIDAHKLSLVAATLPASGGTPEVVRLENTERAIRRLVEKLGGPERLAVCYEAGPGAQAEPVASRTHFPPHWRDE
jgi:hypothetical protein